MSRLIDRILDGCKPSRLSLMIGRDNFEEVLCNRLSQRIDKTLSDKEYQNALQRERMNFYGSEPVATEKFDFKSLSGIPVFAADDVGMYALSLSPGINFADVVASMAPPFDKFFIEFQHVPTPWNLHAWGVYISVRDDPAKIQQFEDDEGRPRWILDMGTFLEYEEGSPVGPVASHVAGLAEDGTWFRHSWGDVWWGGGPVKLTEQPPDNEVQEWGDQIAQLLFPALLTISFMHCKNVAIRSYTPPEKLSNKYRKKHKHDLVRYHVLEIEPIRKLLKQYQTGSRSDLRQALHICRGHFKTFTTDAPLMGSHVGTYWWSSHVRGSHGEGTVLKDYRVNAPSDIGKSYLEANENQPDSDREAPPSKDPDSIGRGAAAHNRIQNEIAGVVRSLGYIPRSPAPNEPEFDVAWKVKEVLFVCEVKSITAKNEERQLRMAIGQVIRYRQKLNSIGFEPVYAVIAVEYLPTDQSWIELCEKENILLLWPDVVSEKLSEMTEKIVNMYKA